MNIRSIFFLFVFLFSMGLSCLSQETPIGQWRDELPYYQVISVTEVDNYIYAETPNDIFSIA